MCFLEDKIMEWWNYGIVEWRKILKDGRSPQILKDGDDGKSPQILNQGMTENFCSYKVNEVLLYYLR